MTAKHNTLLLIKINPSFNGLLIQVDKYSNSDNSTQFITCHIFDCSANPVQNLKLSPVTLH